MADAPADTHDALAPIADLRKAAQADLARVESPDTLEQFRIAYLGSKGRLKALMAEMTSVPKEHKPAFGQAANYLQQRCQRLIQASKL